MKRTISIYDPSVPLVWPEHGMANTAFNLWIKQVTDRGLLIGTGSPEGVIEAQQGVEYLDEEGAVGAVKYIKQLTNIAGDRTKGWVVTAGADGEDAEGDAILGGQSGGQTLHGDTDSGGDLVLESTYHATKGSVYLGDHTNGNEVVIEDDGTLRFDGTATVFRDELNELIGKKLESPSSDIIQNHAEGSVTFEDDCALTDYLVMNIQINHDWKAGSSVYPHLHWWQASSDVPNWLIQYRWQMNGAAKTTSWTSQKRAADVFTYSSGTLNQISTFGSIAPPVGYSISDILQIKLLRDSTNASTLFSGADPLTGDVDAVSFDIHMEIDTVGSRSEYSK